MNTSFVITPFVIKLLCHLLSDTFALLILVYLLTFSHANFCLQSILGANERVKEKKVYDIPLCPHFGKINVVKFW